MSFPYIELPQKQPSFIARENPARVIEIGKRPSAQESRPREPRRSKGIAAGQELYFEY